MAGLRPLGDWTFSLIGRWREGTKFTWTGGGAVPGVLNNVSFKDSWSVDLRIAKNFEIGGRRGQFFIDVFNLPNRKELSFTGFVDGNDQNSYMRSLHLPESPDYDTNIPGDDKVGEFREYSTPYQPMVRIQSRDAVTNPDPGTIYWELGSRSYIVFEEGAWVGADQGLVDQTLETKAYIDMPNQSYLTFLNPRDVFFGIRLAL